MPSTAKFLHVVAKLPHGAVVLPGLDTDLDEDGVEIDRRRRGMRKAASPRRPPPIIRNIAMHALLARFGIKRRDVEILGRPAQGGREVLASEAMRPSSATAEWYDRLKLLDISAQIAAGMDKLAVIEAANPEMEALAIAVAMREARHLEQIGGAGDARPRAGAAGDGGARPLESRIQRFRRRRADGNTGGNFCAAGGGSRRQAGSSRRPCWRCSSIRCCGSATRRTALKHGIEVLEQALLRGTRPQAGSNGLARDFAGFREELRKLRNEETSVLHAAEPRARLRDPDLDQARARDQGVAGGAGAAGRPRSASAHSISPNSPQRHREVLINLSSDHHGVANAFEGPSGLALAAAFDDLIGPQQRVGLMTPLADYAELFQTAFADRMVRRAELADAKLHIFGQLEARLTESDRIILGGLVEGVWPPAPRVDPWLSRPMRHELGLDLPERRIGLSAHDFAQLLGHDEVILTPCRQRSAARPRWPRASCIGWKPSQAKIAGRRRKTPATPMSTTQARSTSRQKSKPIEQPDAKTAARDAADKALGHRDRGLAARSLHHLCPPHPEARAARSRRHAAVGRRPRLGHP